MAQEEYNFAGINVSIAREGFYVDSRITLGQDQRIFEDPSDWDKTEQTGVREYNAAMTGAVNLAMILFERLGSHLPESDVERALEILGEGFAEEQIPVITGGQR